MSDFERELDISFRKEGSVGKARKRAIASDTLFPMLRDKLKTPLTHSPSPRDPSAGLAGVSQRQARVPNQSCTRQSP